MQIAVSTKKYLAQYAEKEVSTALALVKTNPQFFSNCLCLPAYKEPLKNIIRLTEFSEQQPSTLTILVINQPDNTYSCQANNTACHQWLNHHKPIVSQLHTQTLYRLKNDSAVLLIDRYSEQQRIPSQNGVGLARKIAADIALALITQNFIQSPWIFTSDADTVLPEQYFSQITQSTYQQAQDISAILFPFSHCLSEQQQIKMQTVSSYNKALIAANKLYELRLHNYVDGLQAAGSPYAYHTVGSALCIHAHYYAMVRGFPKRAAGEDFYILNKLRKTARIVSLEQPVINILARQSDRTPFGTGQAVTTLLELNTKKNTGLNSESIEQKNDFSQAAIFYHPDLFELLKLTLCWLQQLSESVFQNKRVDWEKHLFSYINNDQKAQFIEPALLAIKFEAGFQHCVKQAKSKEQFDKQMFFWFDAFRTLKWLHYLRDNNKKFENLTRIQIENITKPALRN